MKKAAFKRTALGKALSRLFPLLKTIMGQRIYVLLISIIGFLIFFRGSEEKKLFFIDPDTDIYWDSWDRTTNLEKNKNDTINIAENRDQKHTERKIISMVLYGSNPRYTEGALANAKRYKKVFPGWELRVYLSKSTVPTAIIETLKSHGVEIVYMEKNQTKIKPMMWRFLIAKDYSVDRFIVRDTDSRLLKRDKIEVDMWIKSGKALQCIRDHPDQTGSPILGGMWGGVPSKLKFILPNATFGEDMVSNSTSFYEDEIFLIEKVWPKAKYFAYCSDSFTCKTWDNSHPFQTNRSKYFDFVGEVILGNGERRQYDVDTIKRKSVSELCRPK